MRDVNAPAACERSSTMRSGQPSFCPVMPKKYSIMAAIEIFRNESFGEIRVAGTSDEPLFCLSDVCRILELQSGATKSRLDEKGISLINTPTNGGVQPLIYINEKNLYKTIMRSNKPQAESFQDWVCGDVLPSIRKTGTYSIKSSAETDSVKMQQMKIGVEWVKDVSEILNLNNASKLAMLSEIAKPLNLPLPPYVKSEGTLKSASELLLKMNISISAQVFNKKAIEFGFLCEMERNSSHGQKRKFKSITKKGLKFGENQVSPNNPKSTQPLWYEDKFGELLALIGLSNAKI